MMSPAARVAITASGGFLLVGLLVGIWKYRAMIASPTHQAPAYVDIAHRAALLYSFAALVMWKLVAHSPYSDTVQLWATGVPIFFFATAVSSYLWHGWRRREDTQFSERNWSTTRGMLFLIVGELGGVLVLFWGFVESTLL